jgi:hypothetical protein
LHFIYPEYDQEIRNPFWSRDQGGGVITFFTPYNSPLDTICKREASKTSMDRRIIFAIACSVALMKPESPLQ